MPPEARAAADTSSALDEIADLVTRWRGTRGSMERVRLIASGARTLAGLSPDDRRVLAGALAEQGAPEVAARLEPRTGGALSGGELTELARAVLSIDGETLDHLAVALEDPTERRRLLGAASGRLEDLLGEGPTGAAVPLPPPPDGDDRPAPTPPRPVVLQEAPELSSPDLGDASLGAAALGDADLGHADVHEVTLAAPTATGSAADPVEGETGADGGDEHEAPHDRAPVQWQRQRWSSTTAADPVEPAAAPTEAAGAPTEVARAAPAPIAVRPAADVTAAIRALTHATTARGRLAVAAELEDLHVAGDDVLRVLDAVPDGWQRATVARRLVAGGAIDGVDAVSVVRRLARASDRTAVAGALVDHGVADVTAVEGALDPRSADRLRRRSRTS